MPSLARSLLLPMLLTLDVIGRANALALYTGRLLTVRIRAEVATEAHVRVCHLSLRGPGIGLLQPLTGWAHQAPGRRAQLAPALDDALRARNVQLDLGTLQLNATHLCMECSVPLVGRRTVVLQRKDNPAPADSWVPPRPDASRVGRRDLL